MKRIHYKSFALLGTLLLSGETLLAQDVNGVSSTSLMLALIFTMIALGLVIIVLALTVFYMVREKAPQAATAAAGETAAVALEQQTFSWRWWNKKLVAAVPIEQEATVDMGHNYDGIRELDNKLPPWWLGGFYITIGMAVIYLLVYHVGSDWSSKGEYQEEMAEAAQVKEAYLAKVANMVNETNVIAFTDASKLAEGQEIYTAYCTPCHGAAGQGGIGPNLTDAYWIHGGDVKDIFKTIKYGVIEKGMTPWQDQLKPNEMQAVSSYILSLQGTNPEGAKEPQGELYEPGSAAPADTTTSISMN